MKSFGNFNYHLDVISKDVYNSLYPSIYDLPDLKDNISINILRVSNKINISTLYGHLRCLLKTGYVYKGSHWAIPAIKEAEKLIKVNKYDYILTRNAPSEIVGIYLARKYKIKLITNFNDPFPMERYPPPYGFGPNAKTSKIKLKLLRDIVEYSSYITFPVDRLRDYCLNYFPGLDIKKTFITPHIVDDNLIVSARQEKTDMLKIVHSGDISKPRDPYNFLLALKKIIDSGEKNIQVDFIGRQNANFLELVKELKLDHFVFVKPQLDYYRNLEEISLYDIALIIEAPLDEGIFLPTKVADYLQCNVPIAVCSPPVGVLNDLYLSNTVDYNSSINSVDSIFIMLKKIKTDFENGFVSFANQKDTRFMSGKSIIDKYNKIC